MSVRADFARTMIAMGEFMGKGNSYEDTYRHAATLSETPELRAIWNEMLVVAQQRQRSPLEVLEPHHALLGPWLIAVFNAGTLAGVESLWVKGGRTFLEVRQSFQSSSEAATKGRALLRLMVSGIQIGMTREFAVTASLELVAMPELAGFAKCAEKSLSAACQAFPDYFPSPLIDFLLQGEHQSPDDPYAALETELSRSA